MNTPNPIMSLIDYTVEPLPSPSISAEAEDTRAALLEQSARHHLCTNAAQALALSVDARVLAGHIRQVQSLGLELRRPGTEWLKQVKKLEDDYCQPLSMEKARLERLAGDFNAAERRRIAEETRLRNEEITRLERLRREAEARANAEVERVARENRLAEEAARAAEAQITNKRQLAAAMKAEEARKLEAARQQAIADAAMAASRKASEEAQAAIRQVPPVAAKVAGMSTRRVMEYEVYDINALAHTHPNLVTIEVNKAAVRAIVAPKFPPSSDEVDKTSWLGLAVWWKDQTSTRV